MKTDIEYCLTLDCPLEENCKRKDGSVVDHDSWSVFNFIMVEEEPYCRHHIDNGKTMAPKWFIDLYQTAIIDNETATKSTIKEPGRARKIYNKLRHSVRYNIKKGWLRMGRSFVRLLIRMNLIHKVWYKCEIEYAEIKGKEYAEFFTPDKPEVQ